MIISQGFMLWLGSFPTVAPHQIDEFDSDWSLDPFIKTELIVGWVLDETDQGDQMTAITVKGRLDPSRHEGIISESKQDAHLHTRLMAVEYLKDMRKK